MYITAAPGVSRYGAAELHERGMDAEIEQARYIIWSHQANITPITPEMDAGLLLNIRRAGVVYHKIGPCPPQPLRDDADTHILAVARALRQEKKNNGIFAIPWGRKQR